MPVPVQVSAVHVVHVAWLVRRVTSSAGRDVVATVGWVAVLVLALVLRVFWVLWVPLLLLLARGTYRLSFKASLGPSLT